LQKLKIVLSYDGSRFDGFAVQKGRANTVSNRLYEVFKSIGIFEKFNASGRTDKGVHASFQVIDIEVPPFWVDDTKKLQNELNKKLKPDIMIKKISLVDKDFHSRYSAKKRVYRYIVSFKKPNPYEARYVTFLDKKIDKTKMQKIIKTFEGVHDFDSFKKSKGGTTNFVREIFKARYYEYGDYGVFLFEANGFLRSQIRLMIGFLLKIDSGELDQNQLVLQLKNKKVFSRTLAKPYGLYLAKVIF